MEQGNTEGSCEANVFHLLDDTLLSHIFFFAVRFSDENAKRRKLQQEEKRKANMPRKLSTKGAPFNAQNALLDSLRNTDNVLFTISQVCRRWKAVSEDVHFRKTTGRAPRCHLVEQVDINDTKMPQHEEQVLFGLEGPTTRYYEKTNRKIKCLVVWETADHITRSKKNRKRRKRAHLQGEQPDSKAWQEDNKEKRHIGSRDNVQTKHQEEERNRGNIFITTDKNEVPESDNGETSSCITAAGGDRQIIATLRWVHLVTGEQDGTLRLWTIQHDPTLALLGGNKCNKASVSSVPPEDSKEAHQRLFGDNTFGTPVEFIAEEAHSGPVLCLSVANGFLFSCGSSDIKVWRKKRIHGTKRFVMEPCSRISSLARGTFPQVCPFKLARQTDSKEDRHKNNPSTVQARRKRKAPVPTGVSEKKPPLSSSPSPEKRQEKAVVTVSSIGLHSLHCSWNGKVNAACLASHERLHNGGVFWAHPLFSKGLTAPILAPLQDGDRSGVVLLYRSTNTAVSIRTQEKPSTRRAPEDRSPASSLTIPGGTHLTFSSTKLRRVKHRVISSMCSTGGTMYGASRSFVLFAWNEDGHLRFESDVYKNFELPKLQEDDLCSGTKLLGTCIYAWGKLSSFGRVVVWNASTGVPVQVLTNWQGKRICSFDYSDSLDMLFTTSGNLIQCWKVKKSNTRLFLPTFDGRDKSKLFSSATWRPKKDAIEIFDEEIDGEGKLVVVLSD